MDSKEMLNLIDIQRKLFIKYLNNFIFSEINGIVYFEDLKVDIRQHVIFSLLNPEE